MCTCTTKGNAIIKCDRPSHYLYVPWGYRLDRYLRTGPFGTIVGAVMTKEAT